MREFIEQWFRTHRMEIPIMSLQGIALVWLVVVIFKVLLPARNSDKAMIRMLKDMHDRIDQAVRRAPPIEAGDSAEGVPFEVYRTDLIKMAEGQISIDEFVDLWRGRKVQKRPKPQPEIKEVKQSYLDIVAGPPEEKSPIHDLLGTRWFNDVLKEWALHVKASQYPTIFSDLYLEWLTDPVYHEGRQAATRFVLFIKSRTWLEVLAAIKPALTLEQSLIFATPAAADFFEGFRKMVVDQIQIYWKEFTKETRAQRIGGLEGLYNPPADIGPGPEGINGSCQGPTGSIGQCPGGPPGTPGFSSFVHVTESGHQKNWQEAFPTCSWVRVIRPTSPSRGHLALIVERMKPEGVEFLSRLRVKIQNRTGDLFLLDLSPGDYEWPLPRKGEWWRMDKCQKATCKGDMFDQNRNFIPGPFEMQTDIGPKDPHVSRVLCGCMVPVNFGRGEIYL